MAKHFGRYEIVAELGRGSVGVVYKARDPESDRFVAVRTIPLSARTPDDDRSSRERFLLETQAAVGLLHPGIVAVLDVGEDPGSRDPYIVLEYVAGQPLSRLLSQHGRLRLDAALHLTQVLADALDFAHAQGVIHGDLNPSNILVTSDTHARIADFGLSKLARFFPEKVPPKPRTFLAPEQLQGDKIDGRADLFSLGMILHTMVTGHSPLRRRDAVSVDSSGAYCDPVPANAFDLQLPRELNTVVALALAEDPARRYQRAADFAMDLRELSERGRTCADEFFTTSRASATEWTNFSPAYTADDAAFRRIRHELTIHCGLWGGVEPSTSSAPARAVKRRTFIYPISIELMAVAAVFILGLVSVALQLSRQPAAAAALSATAGEISQRLQRGVISDTAGATSQGSQRSVTTEVTRRPNSVVRPKSNRLLPRVPPVTPPANLETPVQPSADLSPRVTPSASLQIQVQHHFTEVRLSVWVDGNLAYDDALQGEARRHLVVFRSVHGSSSQTVRVVPGLHRIRVRAQSSAEGFDESKTVLGDFAETDNQILRITLTKHGKQMSLALN